MIDYHKNFVAALETVGIPVNYELVLHSGLPTPCYSYQEINNYSTEEGDTLGYSRITYQVKIWANDMATIQKYALAADEVLRPIGFKRIASNELFDRNSTMIQKILTYEGLGLENY